MSNDYLEALNQLVEGTFTEYSTKCITPVSGDLYVVLVDKRDKLNGSLIIGKAIACQHTGLGMHNLIVATEDGVIDTTDYVIEGISEDPDSVVKYGDAVTSDIRTQYMFPELKKRSDNQ